MLKTTPADRKYAILTNAGGEKWKNETTLLRSHLAELAQDVETLLGLVQKANDKLTEIAQEDGGCDHSTGICSAGDWELIFELDKTLGCDCQLPYGTCAGDVALVSNECPIHNG